MSCIIEQQIHYRSTKKTFEKALKQAGIEQLNLDNFPLLEQHSLAQLKLSIGKFETIMAFVSYWKHNTVDFTTLTDQEVISELSQIKGIGKWTIDMILLFTLERPNIFPYDDYHLKQIMVNLYQLDAKHRLKAQLLEVANNWGNQKSLAVLYLFEWKKKYF